MKKIKLASICIDGGTQARVSLDQSAVSDYAEAMERGVEFPPVVVFFDGANHWMADGFHRYFGAKKIGIEDIGADVREGTKRDAILFSAGANAGHGLRRSNADKRKAVETLLADAEWAVWSNVKIASACEVSEGLVRSLRKNEVTTDQPTARTYTTKHGTQAVMNTGSIGEKANKEKTPKKPAPQPPTLVTPDGEDLSGALDEDPLVLLEELQKENEALLSQIKILTAEDSKAELHKMILQRDHAIRQQSEAMDNAQREQKAHAYKHRQLMRCGKAVGEDDPSKIAAAVEAFVRQYKKAA